MRKPRVWIAAVVICLLYWGTWHGYHDDPTRNYVTNPLARHSINFGILIGVGLVGWYGLAKHPQRWALRLWLLIYTAVIMVVAVCGLIDIMVKINSPSFRNLLTGLRLFFSSPVPFGIVLYLAKSTGISRTASK